MSLTKNISICVKCLAIAFGALFLLTSCKALGKEGLVLMTDDSYKATVFATNKIGFGSPDGILWNKGKLYLADEGGVALEVWSQNDGLKKLMDAQFGTESPEDLVIDAQGDVFFSDDDAGGVWEVDASGKPRLLAGKDKGLTSTEGIALAPDGSIRRVRWRKPLFKIKQFAWELFVRRTAALRKALGLRRKFREPAGHHSP